MVKNKGQELRKRWGTLPQIVLLAILSTSLYYLFAIKEKESAPMPQYALAIHGGAGTILKSDMTPEKEAAYIEALNNALSAGEDILANGGSSLDAIVAAIMVMEDSPLFNAGKGAVFNSEGENELDAAIMDGATLNAGSIAGVRRIKNPVLLARAVMENSRHVMLIGDGAEKFAQEQGFQFVEPEYFYTERRWQQLQKVRAADKNALMSEHDADHKFGTVGAVALDSHGNLAAATSTGGLTNKQWGRVGDTPIIGAGTYASNASCAVSGTGHGEYFIRATVAREICALMENAGMSLLDAANKVVKDTLVNMGGEGGIISVDKDGNIALVFNSSGMYRGSVRQGEDAVIGIYEALIK